MYKIKKAISKVIDWTENREYIVFAVLMLILIVIAYGRIDQIKNETAERQKMEETGIFEDTYRLVDKSVEYHGGDHSDYIFVLEKINFFSTDRYVVSVNQADYYQYEKDDRITCHFEKSEDTDIYINFQIKEN